ncbi:MAG: alpha/beta hydrolase [Alphaproteobacteria bacterium]
MDTSKKMILAVASLIAISIAASSTVSAADNINQDALAKAGRPSDSGTMERADKDTKKVLEALKKLGPKPIENLTPVEARKQPTVTDAVMAVMREDGKNPEEEKAKLKVTTQDVTYPAGKGEQSARIYMPEGATPDKKLPVIVYYHGGGFVIADINVYDAAPRALAKKLNAIVVSAEYRHAPENKFPAAHEDAFAAYQWALKNAASWGGDPAKVAIMGESAGGNLAANVAIMARDKGVQAPAHMVLIYPVAGNDMNTSSYQKNANAKPLNKAMMAWFVKHTIKTEADKNSPMINLLGADLKNLPSATVITAEIDPLRSEGEALANKLKGAGVETSYKNYEGVTHEFFGMGTVAKALDAQELASNNLESAFDKIKSSQ